MIRKLNLAPLLACAAPRRGANRPAPTQAIAGTRLDVVATGEVSRVPDIARINAGVVTRPRPRPRRSGRMRRRWRRSGPRCAAAGVADRDIQTSSINLHPDYRHDENAAARRSSAIAPERGQ